MGRTRALRGLAGAARGRIAVVARQSLPAAKKLGKQVADLPIRPPTPKPTAGSTKLRNIVDDIWKHAGRPGSKGDGTTFDALRNEIRTGNPSAGRFHYQKAADLMTGLHKVLADPATSPADHALAQDLLRQFGEAWKGKP